MFKGNRDKYIEHILPSSISIFFSKDTLIKNDSEFFDFCDTNLFYLTGIEQSDTKLVIIKDELNISQEYLFIKKTDDKIKIWGGEKLSKQEAKKLSKIDNIFFEDIFEGFINEIMNKTNIKHKYILKTKNNKFEQRTLQYQNFIKKFQNIIGIPNQKTKFIEHNSFEILEKIRAKKSKKEIEKIKKAINITTKALNDVLCEIKSKKISNEKDIEARLSYVYTKNHAKHAFHPIVASGRNACILHYTKNNYPIKNNENTKNSNLVLIDTGAEIDNYKADISRTYPLSGKFTQRQKQVYKACLKIQKYAILTLKPGIIKLEREKDIYNFAAKELIKLGLFSSEEFEEDEGVAKSFLLHSYGHSIGLDTHDPMNYDIPFETGQVLTVEPGIYIEKEGLGIRIEDIVEITKDGCRLLSKDILKEIEDIEKYLKPNS